MTFWGAIDKIKAMQVKQALMGDFYTALDRERININAALRLAKINSKIAGFDDERKKYYAEAAAIVNASLAAHYGEHSSQTEPVAYDWIKIPSVPLIHDKELEVEINAEVAGALNKRAAYIERLRLELLADKLLLKAFKQALSVSGCPSYLISEICNDQ